MTTFFDPDFGDKVAAAADLGRAATLHSRHHDKFLDWTPPPTMRRTPSRHVRWIYDAGYYDGPLSGQVAVQSGEVIGGDPVDLIFWAEVFEECGIPEAACGFYRRFQLIQLTQQAREEEARRHALFQKYVGLHTDYTETGARDIGALVHPESEWGKYYEQAATWAEWKPEGEIVGWFES